MSVGEFRADVAEFQVRNVSACEDDPEIWHFLAQSRPFSAQFGGQPAANSPEQGFLGACAEDPGLVQAGRRLFEAGVGKTCGAFGHGAKPHANSRRNGPAEVDALVDHVDGHARARIHDHPRTLRVEVGNSSMQHGRGVGHPIQAEGLSFAHLRFQWRGVSWAEHPSPRKCGSPWFEVTTSGDHDGVFRGHCFLPGCCETRVVGRGEFDVKKGGATDAGLRRKARPFGARVADVEDPPLHGQDKVSITRRMSASMRSNTGAVLSGLG